MYPLGTWQLVPKHLEPQRHTLNLLTLAFKNCFVIINTYIRKVLHPIAVKS